MQAERASSSMPNDPCVKDRTRWSYVCADDQIVANTGVCALVGGRQIAIFCVVRPGDDERHFFALDNIDPRSGAAVLARGIIGDINGEAVVASPIYKQHYALCSGECIEDRGLSVASHEVRVANNMVLVRVPA